MGEADEVEAAIELVRERVPDVVLLDVHMPDGGGLAVIEAVARTHPDVRFLALSVSDAAEDVIGVIRAGARGYVTKTISGPELTEAITRVAEGDAVFSPATRRLRPRRVRAIPTRGRRRFDAELDQLTPREREVLRFIARGYTYKEVAGELSISTKTVESHVSAVLRKLQLSNRHQLTRWATERRITEGRSVNTATPSPLRSARATLRPVIAKITDSSGPLTSGPEPCDQSTSVATRRSPPTRLFAPTIGFEFL